MLDRWVSLSFPDHGTLYIPYNGSPHALPLPFLSFFFLLPPLLLSSPPPPCAPIRADMGSPPPCISFIISLNRFSETPPPVIAALRYGTNSPIFHPRGT